MTLDPLRLAVGTLTIIPTKPPRRVDRRVAGTAMTLAPLVGALLALLGGLLLWVLGWGPGGEPPVLDAVLGDRAYDTRANPFLAAALVIGLMAVLTRAMHLDGLADSADGLGTGKPAVEALEVMRRGDVGPFGVVTLVLVLLTQVLSLGVLVTHGLGPAGLCLGLVVSRLALPVLCSRGVPAARHEGLGNAVAGSVGRGRLVVGAALAVLLLVPLLLLAVDPATLSGPLVLRAAVAAAVGLVVAGLVGRRAVHRLGGVTGDVLGAAVEAAFTAVLVVLALIA